MFTARRKEMNKCYGWLGLVTLTLGACAKPPGEEVRPAVDAGMTEEHRTLYALGAALANNLRELDLNDEERRVVRAGFEDAVAGEAIRVDVATEMPRIQALQERRQLAAIAERRKQGAAFIEQQLLEAGTEKSASGLAYRELTRGQGRQPSEHDMVTVHYEGSLIDGEVVDSSRKRGKPTQFRVNGVIACWKEALLKMRVGGRSQIVCPPELAYGNGGSPPAIPPAATLRFDIELLDLSKPEDSRGS
jgi:FKBP-type peptidyl-prolyl cis-trans isomerase